MHSFRLRFVIAWLSLGLTLPAVAGYHSGSSMLPVRPAFVGGLGGEVQKYLESQGFVHPDVRKLFLNPIVYASNGIATALNGALRGVGLGNHEIWREHTFSFDTGNGRRAICSFEIASVPWIDNGVPTCVHLKSCEMDDRGPVPQRVRVLQHGF